ncbi:hypothetical protein B0A49_01068 [Cryomyces minteri]|uniref:Uncharacterized protein n=1 Tax=Cryomyces minteri TaxID=331657 RepID=A0A4U0Y0H9_9PEZI|nr:hypothetical protein B0A49_01068 [Cryomyces minteri]
MLSTWADRVWSTAFLDIARATRPHETPQNKMAIDLEYMRGSWLVAQLEEAWFGNDIELRPFSTSTNAASLDELVENIMLAKQMFFVDYSDEELERAKLLLRRELRRLRTFE